MIQIKPKKAKTPNFKVFKPAFEDTIKAVINVSEHHFGKTTATWKERPQFNKTFKSGRKRVVGTITTRNRIYYFLALGTRVRYATMTRGFRPKTRPRYLASYQGRGGLLKVDVGDPKPGIKAREWQIRVAEEARKMLRDEVFFSPAKLLLIDAARRLF
jgi:hypothetical protein